MSQNERLSPPQYYFPLIEDELIKEGLPVELRALPIIESGLSSTAISHAGAAGLWQFMPSTGRSYGNRGRCFRRGANRPAHRC